MDVDQDGSPKDTGIIIQDTPPAATPLSEEVQLDFQTIDFDLLKLGYEKDLWFTRPNNLGKLRLHNDIWWKDNCIVVPKYNNIRKWIMEEFHDTKYSGHLGLHKTLQNIKRTYW
jgi:hypothetical protein